MVSVTSALTHLVSLLGVCKGGFAYPYHLPAFPGNSLRSCLAAPTPGTPNLLRHPIAVVRGAGILTSLPSTTPFGLALGADSPCADERCARKPWAFGVGAFHPHDRYSCQHSHFRYLQRTSQSTFAGLRNAPLPRIHPEGPIHPKLRYIA